MQINGCLLVGAVLSFVASVLHVVIVFKGAAWYRFFGAGEAVVQASDEGKCWPHVMTLGVALVLALWALYAASGAGLVALLPYTRLALVLITLIYVLRGLAVLAVWLFARARMSPFLFWSSFVCLVYGVVHALGVAQVWGRLGPWL